MSTIDLLKAHGCSNDVFLIDGSPERLGLSGSDLGTFVRALCNRHGSLGADGVYFVDTDAATPEASYFNADGSTAEYCGNGLRCVGRWLLDRGGSGPIAVLSGGDRFEVAEVASPWAGVRNISVRGERPVRFMKFGGSGAAYSATTIPELHNRLRFSAFNGPNPHLVAVVDEYDESLLEVIGVAANADRGHFARGINTSFVLATMPADGTPDYYVRTYERGVGFTPSCASGAVASVATLVTQKIVAPNSRVLLRNNGGPLWISIDGDADNLYPTQAGNATNVYRTEVDVAAVIASGGALPIEVDFFDTEAIAYQHLFDDSVEHLRRHGVAIAA